MPIAVARRVLRFSTQGFYAWLKNPITDRDWWNAHLTNAAVNLLAEDPGFGYRFISDELPALGITASERRVWRLCSPQRLWSLFFQKTRPQPESLAARAAARTVGPLSSNQKKIVLLNIGVFLASHRRAFHQVLRRWRVYSSLETPRSCRSR